MCDEALEILGRDVAYQGFFRIDRYRLRHRLFAGGWSAELTREVFERYNIVDTEDVEQAMEKLNALRQDEERKLERPGTRPN